MAGRTATCWTFLLFSDLLAPLHEMPGPRNQKKHRGSEAKRPKKKGAAKGVIAASLAYAEVVEIPPTNAVAVSPKAASVPDASLRALSLETAYVGSLGPNDASDLAIHASSPPTAPHSPPLRTRISLVAVRRPVSRRNRCSTLCRTGTRRSALYGPRGFAGRACYCMSLFAP
jgi:hypothetical protein